MPAPRYTSSLVHLLTTSLDGIISSCARFSLLLFYNLVQPKGAVCIKSIVAHNNVLSLHVHSPPRDSLSHPEQAPFMVNECQGTIFYFLQHILAAPFLCCYMFRQTNMYHCVIIAYGTQYGNIVYRFISQEQRAVQLSPGVQQAVPPWVVEVHSGMFTG